MPKTVSFILCCCIFQGMFAQAPNKTATVSIPPTQMNEPHQNLLEKFKDKDKFTCVLNVLKSALSEEIDQCIFEEGTKETVLNNLNSILEEERLRDDQSEVQNMRNSNETKAEKALYKKVMKKIATELTKTKSDNSTSNQGLTEIPSMIPIFKPRAAFPIPRNEPNKNIVDCKPSLPRLNQKQVTFVPEKIVQTNVNLIPNRPMFNIPCQRAADVLDMTNVVPEVCGNIDLKTPANLNLVVPQTVPSLPNPAPVISVNCAETEDTVAMLFKPKAISLMQVYGNLLKNITITVLVPYHMSKLATT